jgi:hypothetical protein
MIDWILVKDIFALFGIFYVSPKLVFSTATLTDKINLWGMKKGVKKWLES